ncbi:ABC transporter ATP-binding protein [Paenibacillus sp. 481]|uniref:ABC transporter ATP-binding protein n=1 Tax=Paenibacillus sp. 481 TaxID=2835869 RepID=UPI001E5D6740|nr:ABC transporter ATP-binding protein [Paenibacillus sp. 481]UHA75001.1 ABC transporter ATP-binding protein [Paenibacillus sp. 481]
MVEQHVIELRNVEKSRDRLKIGPLSLNFPQGFVTAIVGENGSGKSTFMGMCMGLLHPEQGEIRLFDQRYCDEQDVHIKQRIGFVPELPNTDDDDLTAEKLSKFIAYWQPNWDWQLYQRLMAKYDVPPKTKLNKMSKGMRRKLDIILALSHHPELLLLDEPSSGLDPLAWRTMIEELQQFMDQGEKGRSIIIATHIIEEVKRLADYVLFMHKGRVLAFTEKDALFDSWKQFYVEGDAQDFSEVPGLAEAIQERQMVRLVASDANRLEHFLHTHDIVPLRTQALELDDILLYMIRVYEQGGVKER